MAEAKENLSFIEFRNWVAYRRKRGSLNAALHAEANLAHIAVLSSRQLKFSSGDAPGFHDFAPHYDKIEPEQKELSFDDFAKILELAAPK